jgi:hypothetical protein
MSPGHLAAHGQVTLAPPREAGRRSRRGPDPAMMLRGRPAAAGPERSRAPPSGRFRSPAPLQPARGRSLYSLALVVKSSLAEAILAGGVAFTDAFYLTLAAFISWPLIRDGPSIRRCAPPRHG